MRERTKIEYIILSVVLLIVIGSFGYYILTDLSAFESLYMTVITISTVGYKEVGELNTAGRFFSIILIFAGLSIVFYAFTKITSFVLEGEFKEYFRRRAMTNKISQVSKHYVLCGAGETGSSVIEQFENRDYPLVVIEKDPDKVNELIERGIMSIEGDATNENILKKAKIEQARGLISSLSSDADNVLVVLTARGLNPDLVIVSRAIEKNAGDKLKRAGADNTISPNVLGGARMTSLMFRPTVVSFLDVITEADGELLDLEDVVIRDGSELLGMTLKEAKIPDKTGLIILAFQNVGEEKLKFNPGPDEILEKGDVMLVLGKAQQIDKLRKMACDDRCLD